VHDVVWGATLLQVVFVTQRSLKLKAGKKIEKRGGQIFAHVFDTGSWGEYRRRKKTS
jgi:hypothetical protein